MAHQKIEEFLTSNLACAEGYTYVSGHQSSLDAAAQCTDGRWLMWIMFQLAGNIHSRRVELVQPLITLVQAEINQITVDTAELVLQEGLAALNQWIDDADLVALGRYVNKWYTQAVREEIASVADNASAISWAIAFMPLLISKTLLIDDAKGKAQCSRQIVDKYTKLLLLTSRVVEDKEQRLAAVATLLLQTFSTYFSTSYPAYIAEIENALCSKQKGYTSGNG